MPWLLRVEQVLFGQWQTVTDDQVRCIYCGSTHVVRKSRQPRCKKYYIETAQGFLAVFEKVYRFTPFSNDAQPAIRGKCPLELAGYDISQLPMAGLCKGLSYDWPMEVAQNDVPK